MDRKVSWRRLLHKHCTLTCNIVHSNYSFSRMPVRISWQTVIQWLARSHAQFTSLCIGTILKCTSSATYVTFTVNPNSKFAVRISIGRRTGLTAFLAILKPRYLDVLLKQHIHDSSKTIHNDSIHSVQDMQLNNNMHMFKLTGNLLHQDKTGRL